MSLTVVVVTVTGREVSPDLGSVPVEFTSRLRERSHWGRRPQSSLSSGFVSSKMWEVRYVDVRSEVEVGSPTGVLT